MFELFFKLNSGVFSVEDAQHSGYLLMSQTNESVDLQKEFAFHPKQKNHYL
jgi:hypothetical protein